MLVLWGRPRRFLGHVFRIAARTAIEVLDRVDIMRWLTEIDFPNMSVLFLQPVSFFSEGLRNRLQIVGVISAKRLADRSVVFRRQRHLVLTFMQRQRCLQIAILFSEGSLSTAL